MLPVIVNHALHINICFIYVFDVTGQKHVFAVRFTYKSTATGFARSGMHL